MNYEDFRRRIHQELNNIVQTDVTVEPKTVRKNNGVVLDAIVLHKQSEQVSPCLYLNHYYEQYKQGVTEAEIIEDILKIVNENKGEVEQQSLITSEIRDFSKVSDLICYRLVNAKMNEALLKTVPHKKFLDLAIVYYVVCKMDEDGIGTILVENSFFEEWNCSLEELHEKAVENTMRIFPPQIRSMEEVIFGIIGREEEVSESCDGSPRMYVASNSMNLQGAAVILYPNLLRDFLHGLKIKARGLVILPSSIHEQIIIPHTEHMEVDSLRAMVREINSTQGDEFVERKEYLNQQTKGLEERKQQLQITLNEAQGDEISYEAVQAILSQFGEVIKKCKDNAEKKILLQLIIEKITIDRTSSIDSIQLHLNDNLVRFLKASQEGISKVDMPSIFVQRMKGYKEVDIVLCI